MTLKQKSSSRVSKKAPKSVARKAADDFSECWDVLLPNTRGGRGKAMNIKGERFGRLRAIKRQGTDEQGSALWLCKCDCKGTRVVSRANLRKGRVKSCGCLQGQRGVLY